MRNRNATLLALLLLVLGGYAAWDGLDVAESPAPARTGEAQLAEAFRTASSDQQVSGVGRVWKVLPDDNDGSRHQRFILELRSGQRLLVAHNIDLAPRIPNLGEGDTVAFFGEYEYNTKGGVIHWTHHDPRGRHVSGWLKHNGRTYQ